MSTDATEPTPEPTHTIRDFSNAVLGIIVTVNASVMEHADRMDSLVTGPLTAEEADELRGVCQAFSQMGVNIGRRFLEMSQHLGSKAGE